MKAMFKSVVVKGINLIESMHVALVNHPFVVRQAQLVLSNALDVLDVWARATEMEVRLYSMEGLHLSRKRGEMSRMTWYTDPDTAKELGEYMGGLTGRLVYVDLLINITSPISYRYYKWGDEALTLKDEMIDRAKRHWKYCKPSDIRRPRMFIDGYAEVAVGKE